MFCQKCGKEIPENSSVCPSCGNPVAPNGDSGNGKKKKKSSRKNRGNKDSGKDNAKQQTDERAKQMEWKDCEISYDPSTHMYRISNTGQSRILLLKDEQIVGIVEPNARVRIERPVTLQVKETKESLQLK